MSSGRYKFQVLTVLGERVPLVPHEEPLTFIHSHDDTATGRVIKSHRESAPLDPMLMAHALVALNSHTREL
jgi:hypothetical protein